MNRNLVILCGRLGSDPDLQVHNTGSVLKLSVATNSTYVDRNDQKQERTEWHRVSYWGKTAQWLSENLKKGDNVYIEGQILTSKFVDKDGIDREVKEIKARTIQKPK